MTHCFARCRLLLLAFVLAMGVSGVAAPAAAQVMKPNGMAIPSFFFSGAERRAREACADELPTCRASVRAQMEQEMAISLVFPWLLLAAGILFVLFQLRKKEREKAKARMAARAHHNPGAFRKLDKEKEEKRADDDEADQLS